MNKSLIYATALEQWGFFSQTNMLIEECAELILAMQKYNHRTGDVDNVLEELADVEIMCEQMRLIFDSTHIDQIKKQKLERLEGLIHRHDSKNYELH